MADVLAALGKVCEDVREGTPEEGVLGVRPGYVAAPGTAEEAGAVMRVAAEHGLAVVPRGNETRLDWGRPPARCDLLLDTARLDRVIEHAAGDLVVKVEAGLTMERLAQVLAERGQRLALDVPLPGSTVGGTLATAAAGPSRLRYGSPRDLLIGVTMIRADGAAAKAGGRVVKNVAGYDLGKLLTGSFGTLGLIVEAVFRLHPIPAARAYVCGEFADAERAHQAVQRVLQSMSVPSAIEVNGPPMQVAVLVEGVSEGLGARSAAVAESLGPDAEISSTPPGWWGAYPEGSTLIEVNAPPTTLPRLAGEVGDEAVLRGSAGAGVWHVGLDADRPSVVTALTERLRHAASATGSVVVRYAPEAIRAEVDFWGPVPALSLMRRVKDQFDPDHRLSPGRFLPPPPSWEVRGDSAPL